MAPSWDADEKVGDLAAEFMGFIYVNKDLRSWGLKSRS
jgi:hypothetical protein